MPQADLVGRKVERKYSCVIWIIFFIHQKHVHRSSSYQYYHYFCTTCIAANYDDNCIPHCLRFTIYFCPLNLAGLGH